MQRCIRTGPLFITARSTDSRGRLKKGGPMGYFLFGGQRYRDGFQAGVEAELLCPGNGSGEGYEHILTGEAYARLGSVAKEE